MSQTQSGTAVAHTECAHVPTAPRQPRRIPKQRAGRRRRQRSLQGPDGCSHAGAARACWAPPRGQRGTAAAQRRSVCSAVVRTAELARQRWPATCSSVQASASRAGGSTPSNRQPGAACTVRASTAAHADAARLRSRAAPGQRKRGANYSDEQRRITTPSPCSHAAAAFKALSPKLHGKEQRRWRSTADTAALRLRLRRAAAERHLPLAGAGAARRTDTSRRACFSRGGTPLAVRSAAAREPPPRAPTFAFAA